MTIFDKTRRGREHQEVNELALEAALKNWEEAPEEEKPKYALAVLSNIGAMRSTLDDKVTNRKKALAIRSDANRAFE